MGRGEGLAAGVEWLVDRHLSRYPEMQVRDVYKLLYQGILGPEHLIRSRADFAARLAAEDEGVPAREGDPLWEAVRADSTLGRVNLRPFKAAGGDLRRLTQACLRTAKGGWGTEAELRAAWGAFGDLCVAGRWPGFEREGVSAFSAWLEEQGYPAVHHSPPYRETYQPAYRLVSRRLVGTL